ncbi:hypothetical protein POJ06DRAFT_110284 [Lipomyces tetrasporus]|uniref:Uncharacterized protein n=1 Tax=Lipomyces tetrasporus TaxID=54092 RepID=A0AAD7VTG9_9ASCO|nr:uncharacterized protein POJ06DRAFT_110284 [Lipomyces tetrasporus]KAJ8100719.1 hypothetical protein POJ06DRAFT_110284 [Lipomyces tetrasporus]
MHDVSTTSPKQLWTTAKCHRVLRPLSSKLQSLRNLIASHPSLVNNARDNASFSAENSLEQATVWEKHSRAHSGNIRKYAVKSSQSQSKSLSQRSRVHYPAQESNRSGHYCVDNLLLSLRDKTPPEVYAAYRSIFHAFHHFLLQTYERPTTLAQKSAIELGKCVVYTLGSVSEDDWYDGMEVLKYYKRYIAIGHGISLVARDAEICKDLLPVLIVDCAEMESFDMGLLLLRSLLEVTPIDDILVNFDMLCKLSGLVKSSPYILLQYIMTNLTVTQITHPNLLEIINRLVVNPLYDTYSKDVRLRNTLCHIFATIRRAVRKPSHPQFKEVETAILSVSSIICRHPNTFDLSFITNVVNTIGPAKTRFTSVWQLLCIHQFYLGHINQDFVQYFSAPSTTPSASFRIRSKLRVALLDIYTDFEEQVKPIIERLMENVPKFSVALATVFAAKFRHEEVLRWRGDIERSAMGLDRGLRTKNWVYDESLEEWVEAQEDSGRAFTLVSDDDSEDESTGHVSDPLSAMEAQDEQEITDDEQLIQSSERNFQLGENISSQGHSSATSHDDSKSTIPTSPVTVTVARPSGASSLLFMFPPPSSVVKLTPRSNRRIRDKYFRLLSTPATSSSSVRRPKPNWFSKRMLSDDGETECQDGIDEFENASPLQGRRRLASLGHGGIAKKSRQCMTSNLVREVSRTCSRQHSPEFCDEVDELSMTVTLDRGPLGDLTNRSRDAVGMAADYTSSNVRKRNGSFRGRKLSDGYQIKGEDEDQDELFAL